MSRGPSLKVPMARQSGHGLPYPRTSGLVVPMTKASAMSIPTSRGSFQMPVPKFSQVKASGVLGAAIRDAAAYMAEIKKLADDGVENMDTLLTVMSKPERGGTRISYTNIDQHIFPKSIHELLDKANKDAVAGNLAVCVVENVSPAMIKTLGAAWGLEPEFFAIHASNPPVKDLWRHYPEWKPPRAKDKEELPNYDHLDGIYEFHDMDLSVELMQRSSQNYCHRHVFKDCHWPVNINTRISYARVAPSLYIFLVDPPIRYEHAIRGSVPYKILPTVRFPYAQNRGGVLLPSPLAGKHFVPFTALERIFRHAWQLELLFQPEDLFPNVPFLYLMSFSLWYSKLHRLDKDIKKISFQDIREPDLRITTTLHDLREDLSTLQNVVGNTRYYASHGIAQFYRDLWEEFPYTNMLTPLDGHEAIAKNAYQLHSFLLETFQLLMNTITVRDSQLSIRQTHESLIQTRQSIILTRLATFYLPWTLTTGVFGMNIKQMTGQGQSIWVFIVTGVLTVVGTILVFQLQISSWKTDNYRDLFKWSWWMSEGFKTSNGNDPLRYNY